MPDHQHTFNHPETTVALNPVIDRTECSTGTYRVGSPGAPGFGTGRLLRAERAPSGWQISSVSGFNTDPNPDADVLCSYLEGPRRVRVHIVRRSWPQNESTTIAIVDHEIPGAPDPEDYRAWNAWVFDVAMIWLRQNPPSSTPEAQDSTWTAIAVDRDLAHCAGVEGLWSLSRSVDLPSPTVTPSDRLDQSRLTAPGPKVR